MGIYGMTGFHCNQRLSLKDLRELGMPRAHLLSIVPAGRQREYLLQEVCGVLGDQRCFSLSEMFYSFARCC